MWPWQVFYGACFSLLFWESWRRNRSTAQADLYMYRVAIQRRLLLLSPLVSLFCVFKFYHLRSRVPATLQTICLSAEKSQLIDSDFCSCVCLCVSVYFILKEAFKDLIYSEVDVNCYCINSPNLIQAEANLWMLWVRNKGRISQTFLFCRLLIV